MKGVYKSIDLSKINNNNFESIFEQYKKHSVLETLDEMKRTTSQANTSDLKYKRDFNSNPNSGNKLMERPTPTKMNESPSNINQRVMQVEQNRKTNTFQGVPPGMNSYESNLDQVFKPIVDDTEINQYSNFSSGKIKDVASKMDEVQKSRQSERASRKQRPPTPDFLKSQKSNPDRDSISDSRNDSRNNMKSNPKQQPQQNNKSNNDRPDFTNANSSDMNQGFQGLANDMGDNLFSLDNIDKPLHK
jgi:hypothetical protein